MSCSLKLLAASRLDSSVKVLFCSSNREHLVVSSRTWSSSFDEVAVSRDDPASGIDKVGVTPLDETCAPLLTKQFQVGCLNIYRVAQNELQSVFRR